MASSVAVDCYIGLLQHIVELLQVVSARSAYDGTKCEREKFLPSRVANATTRTKVTNSSGQLDNYDATYWVKNMEGSLKALQIVLRVVVFPSSLCH